MLTLLPICTSNVGPPRLLQVDYKFTARSVQAHCKFRRLS